MDILKQVATTQSNEHLRKERSEGTGQPLLRAKVRSLVLHGLNSGVRERPSRLEERDQSIGHLRSVDKEGNLWGRGVPQVWYIWSGGLTR